MLGLLERNIASIERRLVVLAPRHGVVPAVFHNLMFDAVQRRRLLADVQRLRGAIYRADGALRQEDLTRDGRHRTPEDDRSWHLVMTNGGAITASVWYRDHDNTATIDSLRVRDCPLRYANGHDVIAEAIESELARARRHALRYAEVGGWAVSTASRRTADGLLLALAAFSLGRLFGGALGLTTATVRHCSSTILRRLGGSHLEAGGSPIAPYYDPRYDCTMELLRFDSRRPNARYNGLVELLKGQLARVAVIADPAVVRSIGRRAAAAAECAA
jgi:hypothetical protein